MLKMVKRLWKEEKGQGMTEYGLIIALVAIAIIVALTAMSGKLSAVFTKISTSLGV